jgi:hypothetical protein
LGRAYISPGLIECNYCNKQQLTSVFSYLPGGVHKAWLNRNLKDLPLIYLERERAFKTVEAAETRLLATATAMHREKLAVDAKAGKQPRKALVNASEKTVSIPAGTTLRGSPRTARRT